MATTAQTCYRHPEEETRVRCTRCDRPICPECMTPAPVGHHCPTCVAEGRRAVRRRRRLRAPRSVTNVLIAANVAMFVVELALGGATIGVLVQLGAIFPQRVAEGEYWRLLTSMFLHVGYVHLALNMVTLYIFGGVLERVVGSLRFAALYLVTGFVGSAVSFTFGGPLRIAAGASGAIFGLLGAWLAYNWRRRRLSAAAQGNLQVVLILLGANLVLGVVMPGIDNAAHLGGLAAGIVAGLVAEGWGRGRVRAASIAVGLTALAAAGALMVAIRIAG